MRSLFLKAQGPVMSKTPKIESTLTNSDQTTVPEAVHRALTPGKDDTLRDAIHGSSDLTLSRAGTSEEGGPLRQQFLDFLAADISNHPDRLVPMDEGFVKRLRALVVGVDVDLDAPLPPDES